MFVMRKMRAFTLAEVLITLGIIGVVAALTIPVLLQKNKEVQTVSAVKKAYSILQSAYTSAVQDDGTPDTWNAATGADVVSHFEPYLKVQSKKNTCDELTPMVGGGVIMGGLDILGPQLTLSDGSIIAFTGFSTYNGGGIGCTLDVSDGSHTTPALEHVCQWVMYDINGRQKPNMMGYDGFGFFITTMGIVPFGLPADADGLSAGPYSTSRGCATNTAWGGTPNGMGCTAWLINVQNMDYLKCTDISWSGKHKCD